MPDVFLSYSRAHRDVVVQIANLLREFSLDVWFDLNLQAGSVFASEIEAKLIAAKCVLVLWTKDAVKKGPRGWVYSEADSAREHQKLIQAQLEFVKLHPPFFSSQEPPIDLSQLPVAAAYSPNFLTLLERIGEKTNRPGLPEFYSARTNDAELVSWAKRHPRDPIIHSQVSLFEAAAAHIEAEHERQKQRQLSRFRSAREGQSTRLTLASELRDLTEATRMAPVDAFGPTSLAQATSDGTVTFRQDVAELWPRSASAFAALGLDVNVYGLEFYDLAVERSFDGPMPLLLVSGEVRNICRDTKAVPPVRVSLRDARSHEIFDLVNAVTNEPLAAGASTPFLIRVENPPVDAVDLEATFADHGEMAYAGSAPRVSPSSEYDANELLLTEPVDGADAHAPDAHEPALAATSHAVPAAAIGKELPGLRHKGWQRLRG